jgi:hypothetical protein
MRQVVGVVMVVGVVVVGAVVVGVMGEVSGSAWRVAWWARLGDRTMRAE